MKNIQLALNTTFLLLVITHGISQDIALGVKGGLNLTSLTGDTNAQLQGRATFHGGVFVEIPLMEQLNIQPELMYSSQGFRLNGVTGINEYLNLPIMGKFYPVDFLYVETGPQIGFLLAAAEKGNGQRIPIDDVYRPIDFAWGFGAGYTLPDSGFSFGLRYNLGLTNTIDLNNGARLKNGVFQLGTSYRFN